MSETSSAVLDLKDDLDDPEPVSLASGSAPALMDGAAPPLIMEHGYDIAVKVDSPLKQLCTLETFVTYRVRCICARWPTPPQVRRRYNHFKVLHKRLAASHPLIAPPPLPPLHSARQQLDRYEANFVAVRAMALDHFLNRVAKHPILTHSEDFRLFVTTPDEELDKVFKSESSALNLWGLSSALYGSGEAKPANGARVKDPEFSSAIDYLQSLQQKLTTLNTLTSKLYKGNASLGNELMSMFTQTQSWCATPRSVCQAARSSGVAHTSAGSGGLRHAAVLPMLASYASQHIEKITQRNALHAAYVSGTNSTGDLHNRLEQSSEALRSELADWNTKTRTEIKSLLLDLADRQLRVHQQNVMAWENALKMSSGTNIEELFKTVSKNAVLNLSPSKSRVDFEPETELDVDDIDLEIDDLEYNDNCTKVNVNGDTVESSKNPTNFPNIECDSRDVEETIDHRNIENVEVHIIDDVKSVKSQDSNTNRDEKSTVSDVNKVDIATEDDKASDSSKVDKTSDGKTFSDPLQDFAEINLDGDENDL